MFRGLSKSANSVVLFSLAIGVDFAFKVMRPERGGSQLRDPNVSPEPPAPNLQVVEQDILEHAQELARRIRCRAKDNPFAKVINHPLKIPGLHGGFAKLQTRFGWFKRKLRVYNHKNK